MRIAVPALPERWANSPTKSLFNRVRRPPRAHDEVVTAFRNGVVTLRSNRRVEGFTNAVEEHGYQGVRRGDLVIHSMDGFAGAIGVSDSDGKASPVVHCYLPVGETDARFYAYLLRHLASNGFITSLAKGIRERSTAFDAEAFRSLIVPVPPPADQKAIADFLDIEAARIDTLITKKRRLIQLLEEREGAFIEGVLTDVVAEEVPLRRLLLTPPAYGASESGVDGETEWPRYIRITDLTDEGGLRPDGVLRLPPEVAHPYLLRDGDLLVARSGATVGKAFLYRDAMGTAAFAGYLIQFRPDQQRVLPEMLAAWTRTRHYWSQVRLASLQATIENVSAERYKDFVVPLLPRVRQEELVGLIARANKRIRQTLLSLECQVNLLAEHRQALIAAAVMGEIDLPGVAA